MSLNSLDFEQPIAELEAKIEELRMVSNDSELNISEEINRLEQKSQDLTKSIFSSLSAWQVTQLARHPMRPHAIDYINNLFTEFDELHGDRHSADPTTIIGGIARLEGQPVMVLAQEKGRSTNEKVKRNFGMPLPEDYRKALRLMHMAERFNLPVLTFIDTPGAYPGIEAEEHNQSEAIARNLFEMSKLKTPIICTVTGEGGSGGALAIGVGDRVMMLQYSIYSVISPEGCASILWKTAEKAPDAAEALGVNAQRVHELGLVEQVIEEPLGGAHRNPEMMYASLKQALLSHLAELTAQPIEAVVNARYEKLVSIGVGEE